MTRQNLALEPDFRLGALDVRPSACRVLHLDIELRVEAQTMSALVVLARANGATVTREELINACWHGRFVSDDAIARTISKVRMLARGVAPQPFVLEAVPKVGYRLVARAGDVAANEPSLPPAPPPGRPGRSWLTMALIAGLIPLAFWLGTAYSNWVDTAREPQPGSEPDSTSIQTRDIMDAIMSLNGDRLAQYLQAGWRVDWPLDTEGNTALESLPLVCERAPNHDRAGLLELGKVLVAAGANTGHQNKWGDTAYVIARENRYCSPQHPLTSYLRSLTPGAELDAKDKQLGARTP